MTAFILRRSLQSVLVLFIMSLIVFAGVNLIGDPVDMLINPEADQAEIDRVIKDLGLDRPVTEQYWFFTKEEEKIQEKKMDTDNNILKYKLQKF